jgi:CrcB protein
VRAPVVVLGAGRSSHATRVARTVPRFALIVGRSELVAIFAGGCAGALTRLAVVQGLTARPGDWPWATFLVNVVGAFLLGVLITWVHERRAAPPGYLPPLLGTGFCGALTTFSAMQLDLLRLLDAGRIGLAVAYALGSVAAGLAGVVLASGLVRRIEAPA